MRSLRPVACTAALALVSLLQTACDDPAAATRSTAPEAFARGGPHASASTRLVTMKDACDPTTFNAAVGPGTCTRTGGVTFEKFIAQLTKHGSAGAWHFAPPEMTVDVGTTLLAVNRGGEVHTFTEVEEFGGGIVEDLNQLSGNPVPAPECLALEADDFVPPGGTYTADAVEEAGTEFYQCCIHPWMRTVVHAHES